MSNSIRYPVFFIVMAVAVAITISLFPDDLRRLFLREHGPVEAISMGLWFILALAMLTMRHLWLWAVMALIAALRESAFHASSFIPMPIAVPIALVLIAALLWQFVRRDAAKIVIGYKNGRSWFFFLTLALVFLAASQVFEILSKDFSGHGALFPKSSKIYWLSFEETFEMFAPLCLLVSVAVSRTKRPRFKA